MRTKRCERCPDEDTDKCETCNPEEPQKEPGEKICPACHCINGDRFNYCWNCGKYLNEGG